MVSDPEEVVIPSHCWCDHIDFRKDKCVVLPVFDNFGAQSLQPFGLRPACLLAHAQKRTLLLASQGLATRWLARVSEVGFPPLDYKVLPGRVWPVTLILQAGGINPIGQHVAGVAVAFPTSRVGRFVARFITVGLQEAARRPSSTAFHQWRVKNSSISCLQIIEHQVEGDAKQCQGDAAYALDGR